MKINYDFLFVLFSISVVGCGTHKYRIVPSMQESMDEIKLLQDSKTSVTANYYMDYYVEYGLNYMVLDYMYVTDSAFKEKYFRIEYIVVHSGHDLLLRVYAIGPIDTTIKVGSIINFKKVVRKKPGYLFYKKLNTVLDRQSSMQRYWTYSTFAVVEKVKD